MDVCCVAVVGRPEPSRFILPFVFLRMLGATCCT